MPLLLYPLAVKRPAGYDGWRRLLQGGLLYLLGFILLFINSAMMAPAAQANAVLRPLATTSPQGGSATGRLFSARSNPAVLLYLQPQPLESSPSARAFSMSLGQLGAYVELGPAGRLTRLVEDLQLDLEALQWILAQNFEQLDTPLSQQALLQLARWDTHCEALLVDQEADFVAACLEGAIDQIERHLLLSLEEGARFQAGVALDLPGFPLVGRWHPWAGWAVGISLQGQAAGRFYGDRLRGRAVLELSHHGESLLSLSPQFSPHTFSATFFEFQRLSWRYLNEPDSLVDPAAGAWSPEAGLLQHTLALLAQAPEGEAPLLTATEVLALQALNQRLSDPEDPLFAAALRNELDLHPQARLETHSAITTHAAQVLHFYWASSVDASSWWQWPSSWGQLDLGWRLNAYQLNLAPNLVSLHGIVLSEESERTMTRLIDEWRSHQHQTWLWGVDVGLLWQDAPWQLGLTMFNLNQPRATYPSLSRFKQDTDAEALVHLVAQARLTDPAEYSLRRHAVLEATFFAFEPYWILRGQYSFTATENLVGWSEQAYGLSSTFQTPIRWLPNLRLGWRRNQVGSRLDTLHLGIDFGTYIQFDLASSYQTLAFEQWRVPRAIAFGLSFERLF